MTIPPNSSGEKGDSQPPAFQPGIDDAVFFAAFHSRTPVRDESPNMTDEEPSPRPFTSSEPDTVRAPNRRSKQREEPEKRTLSTEPASAYGLRERYSASAAIPICVFAVVAAIALMPLFVAHLGHLSHMPHRAHYAMVLGGFALLVGKRWREATTEPQLSLRVADVVILAMSCLLFAMASQLGSPWLAAASLVVLSGIFLRRLPSTDDIGYAGPWAFLLLLLPLPLGFDRTLIGSLQSFATVCSSRLLDLMSVNHLVSGNVLEIPGRQLFIDEACSGIQSLFAMLTCVAFFVIWTRRPAILAIPLLVSSCVMCTIVNIFRVVLVVMSARQGVDLTGGWPHECLGAGLFVLALTLVYCSEGFFLFLLAPIINPATGSPDNRTARFWNNLTRSIHTVVYGVAPSSQQQPSRMWLNRFVVPQPITKACVFAATICFAFFGVSQHIHGRDSSRGPGLGKIESRMLQRSEALTKDSLPELLGPWKQVSFDRIDRNKGLITDSVAWIYRSPYYEATLSLDYPFFGSHNVSECYHLTGWDVREQRTTELGYSKATLSRPFGENALLFYDVFDAAGTVELESVNGRLAERLQDLHGRRPTWQLQLIVRSDFGLSRSDLEEIELVFRDVRTKLRLFVSGETTIAGGAK